MLLVLVLLATTRTTEAATYTSGSTSVKVSEEIIDTNNSTRKCVEYTSGAPEKWEKGCFTTEFSDGGTFIKCDVQLGETSCASCTPCETDDSEVGYILDCYNIEPEENTKGLCVFLSDETVQEVLVDLKFQSQPFEWGVQDDADDNKGDTVDNQGDSNTGDEDANEESGASGMVLVSTGALVVSAAVAWLDLA